jgi:hypothetical protein
MKNFTRPENLNGTELIAELLAVEITVDRIVDHSDGTISFETDDEATAAEVVAAHNGTTIPPEPTIEDKLASVGLSLPDLKAALGL